MPEKRLHIILTCSSQEIGSGRVVSCAYEYHHTVGFEESNVMGNVYYVNHLRWQGRYREMLFKDHCPDLFRLCPDLKLVTVDCSCEYLAELFPFDDIVVRMSLAECLQSRFTMSFELAP